MKPRYLFLSIATACIGLLAVALYLQLVEHMQPCPLCIMQRYAFAAVALICLVWAALPRSISKLGAGLGMLGALSGAGIALWHLWVKAHPDVSCGIDPLETSLNKIPPAQWFPALFQADGLCSTPYAPILGLSIPQWSLVWFVGFALALGWAAFKRQR